MSNISFDMKANDENVQKTLVKQQAEIAKLIAQNAELEKQSKKNAAAASEVAKALAAQGAETAKLTAQTQAHIDAKQAQAEAEREVAEVLKREAAEEAEAAKVTEKHRTATEKYNAAIAKLNMQRRQGLISVETHTRAMKAEQVAMQGSDQAVGKFQSSLGELGAMLATAGSGFSVMGLAIKGVRMEYDALLESQNKSRDANVTLGKAQEALLDNLGGANAGEVFGRINALSKEKGVMETDLTTAVNETMAAKADRSLDDVMKAVSSATDVSKADPSRIPVIASATLDVQKQTGMNTDQSLGYLKQLQSQSRVKDLQSLAQNVTPAIGGVMNFGADQATAGAMIAALSHGMGDTTGAQSKTAGIQLAKQLREFGGAGSDIGETIRTIQSDSGVRANFFGKKDEGGFGATFEAAALPAIESLLSGGTQAQQFASAQAVFANDPIAALEEAKAARGASQAIGLVEKKNAFENAADHMRRKNVSGAESAVVREGLAEIRKATPGASGIVEWGTAISNDIASGGYQSAEQAIAQMDAQANDLEKGKTDQTSLKSWMMGITGGLLSRDDREKYLAAQNLSNPEFVDQAKALREVVDLLKLQLEHTAAQQEAAERLVQLQEGRNNAGAMAGKAAAQKERVD